MFKEQYNNSKKLCLTQYIKTKEIFLNEIVKIGLSPFDDKLYTCETGIDTLPYGY